MAQISSDINSGVCDRTITPRIHLPSTRITVIVPGFCTDLIIFYGDQFSPLARNTFRKLLLSGKQVVGPINRSIIRVGAVSRKIPFVGQHLRQNLGRRKCPDVNFRFRNGAVRIAFLTLICLFIFLSVKGILFHPRANKHREQVCVFSIRVSKAVQFANGNLHIYHM
jgi:hypothetical protein